MIMKQIYSLLLIIVNFIFVSYGGVFSNVFSAQNSIGGKEYLYNNLNNISCFSDILMGGNQCRTGQNEGSGVFTSDFPSISFVFSGENSHLKTVIFNNIPFYNGDFRDRIDLLLSIDWYKSIAENIFRFGNILEMVDWSYEIRDNIPNDLKGIIESRWKGTIESMKKSVEFMKKFDLLKDKAKWMSKEIKSVDRFIKEKIKECKLSDYLKDIKSSLNILEHFAPFAVLKIFWDGINEINSASGDYNQGLISSATMNVRIATHWVRMGAGTYAACQGAMMIYGAYVAGTLSWATVVNIAGSVLSGPVGWIIGGATVLRLGWSWWVTPNIKKLNRKEQDLRQQWVEKEYQQKQEDLQRSILERKTKARALLGW